MLILFLQWSGKNVIG